MENIVAEETKIIEKIDEKIYLFKELWGENPKYIKIPLWAYNLLRNEIRSRFGGTIFRYNKYSNCNLCPTITIAEIEEIEVF